MPRFRPIPAPITPIRQFELLCEARADITSDMHASFIAIWAKARTAALAATMANFKPASPGSSIVVPATMVEAKRPKLIICGHLCGDPTCGRLVASDGSIWPDRDTGFRIRQLTGHSYGAGFTV